ncbi:hypothetical protein BSA145_21175 (plasmid) [Bacillus safensis]|uniref:Uncharacterized protein n=1 Tax=Bacillus safensis TaxID=561879 RepID=A0A1L6ZPD5_BACIA|nr:hypothetical protein BSA145_21175 [Bacillus safensis]
MIRNPLVIYFIGLLIFLIISYFIFYPNDFLVIRNFIEEKKEFFLVGVVGVLIAFCCGMIVEITRY